MPVRLSSSMCSRNLAWLSSADSPYGGTTARAEFRIGPVMVDLFGFPSEFPCRPTHPSGPSQDSPTSFQTGATTPELQRGHPHVPSLRGYAIVEPQYFFALAIPVGLPAPAQFPYHQTDDQLRFILLPAGQERSTENQVSPCPSSSRWAIADWGHPVAGRFSKGVLTLDPRASQRCWYVSRAK